MKELLLEFLSNILKEVGKKRIAVSVEDQPSGTVEPTTGGRFRAKQVGTNKVLYWGNEDMALSWARGQKSADSADGVTTGGQERDADIGSNIPKDLFGKRKPFKLDAEPSSAETVVRNAATSAAADSRLGRIFGYVAKKTSQISRMMAIKAFETTIETRLPADKKEQGKRLVTGLTQLLEAHSKGDTKTAQQLVQELQDEFKFYSNSSGTTFKTKVFGMGERHFIGKTVMARDLVEIFDKYRPKGTPSIQEAEDQDGTFKGKLEGASKPKIGEMVTRITARGREVKEFKPAAFDARRSPRVTELLSGLPQVADKFKSIYGPTGEDGDLLDNTGGKNSREYFKHSISKNASLNETAAALQEGGFSKMSQAVLDHKNRLEEIEQNWDNYTPEERQKAVEQSYSDMAVRLHSTGLGGDSEMCNAIMKNLAEMSLYESELAGGQEVYLPAAGSFPAADKLIRTGGGTQAERIDKISVKYGKNGKVYGMPAQSSTIALMHTDSFYHNLTSGRVGVEGAETGVVSSVLEPDKWQRLMEESGYSACLTKKTAGESIRRAFEAAQTIIVAERVKLKPQPPTNKDIARMMKETPRIQAARDAIAKELEKGIDKDKLVAHGGQERIDLLRKPFAFASMMTMDATIVSSQGLPELKHAHMEMMDEDDDGVAEKMSTEVESGDAVLSHWHYGWREADERGGGLLVGFAKH